MCETTVKIDGMKLREILEKRGLVMSDVSKTFGFQQSYISKATRVNKIGKPAVTMLDRFYNIKLELYEAKEEIEEQISEQETEDTGEKPLMDLTDKELSELIYKAVYSAVLHAWENDEPEK